MQRTTQRLSSVGRSRGVAPAAAANCLPSSCSTPQALLAGSLSNLIISGKFTASFVFVSLRFVLLILLSAFYFFHLSPCAVFFLHSLLFTLCDSLWASPSLFFLFFFCCLHNKTLCILAQFQKYLYSLCCCCSSLSSSSLSSFCYCCNCWFLYLLTVELWEGEEEGSAIWFMSVYRMRWVAGADCSNVLIGGAYLGQLNGKLLYATNR